MTSVTITTGLGGDEELIIHSEGTTDIPMAQVMQAQSGNDTRS